MVSIQTSVVVSIQTSAVPSIHGSSGWRRGHSVVFGLAAEDQRGSISNHMAAASLPQISHPTPLRHDWLEMRFRNRVALCDARNVPYCVPACLENSIPQGRLPCTRKYSTQSAMVGTHTARGLRRLDSGLYIAEGCDVWTLGSISHDMVTQC